MFSFQVANLPVFIIITSRMQSIVGQASDCIIPVQHGTRRSWHGQMRFCENAVSVIEWTVVRSRASLRYFAWTQRPTYNLDLRISPHRTFVHVRAVLMHCMSKEEKEVRHKFLMWMITIRLISIDDCWYEWFAVAWGWNEIVPLFAINRISLNRMTISCGSNMYI